MTIQRILLMMAVLLLAATSAPAQPWRDLEPLGDRQVTSFEEAAKLAKETNRVLIVYPRGSKEVAKRRTRAALIGIKLPGVLPTTNSPIADSITDAFTLMEQRTWAHPELHSWIEKNAILYTVEMGGEQTTEFTTLMRETRRPLDGHPHAMVFIGDELVSVLPEQNPERCRDVLDPSRWFPKPEQILYEAMNAVERRAAKDPVWGMSHERFNPPTVVHIKTFHDISDRLAPAFDEPADASQEQVLAIWREARVAAASGDSAHAISAYTWLWERASKLAPESVGTRSWLLASEMADLARRDPHAHARFTAMHDAMGEWWASLSSEQWVDYFTLGEVVGREIWSFDYLSGNTVGWFASAKTTPGDLPMLSAAQRVKFDLLSSRDRWTDGTDGTDNSSDPSSVIDRLVGFNRLLNTLNAQNASLEEIDDAIGIYRRVVRHEVTLAYVTMMSRGDTNAADEIRQWYTTHERLGAEFAQQLIEFAEVSSLDVVSPPLER